MSLVLRELTLSDEKAFKIFVDEWDLPDFALVYGLFEGMSFQSYLDFVQDSKDELKISSTAVPSTTLYALINQDIVGRISIRHRLNESLEKFGGHIGYAVATKYQGKGIASEMLKFALGYCINLGMDKVLLTCDESNFPSRKVIEKNGGIYEGYAHNKRRYWISLISQS